MTASHALGSGSGAAETQGATWDRLRPYRWVVYLVALLLYLAAEPPNPGQPAFVPLCAVVGGFIGGALSKVRHLPRSERLAAIQDGAWWGTGAGLGIYLTALSIDLLF